MFERPEYDLLVNTTQAADYLGLSPRTLERWRVGGGGPAYVVLGSKSVRYRRSALDAFLAAGERTSTSQTPTSTRGEA